MARRGTRAGRLVGLLVAVALAVQAGCLRHATGDTGGGCKT